MDAFHAASCRGRYAFCPCPYCGDAYDHRTLSRRARPRLKAQDRREFAEALAEREDDR